VVSVTVKVVSSVVVDELELLDSDVDEEEEDDEDDEDDSECVSV
jgi:hypothetical protein